MTFQAAVYLIWRVSTGGWRVMVFNHVSRLYKTLQTFDQKIVNQLHHARDRHYPITLTVTGSYPDRSITSCTSNEPIDTDFIPDL